jgi:hypothetical protein
MLFFQVHSPSVVAVVVAVVAVVVAVVVVVHLCKADSFLWLSFPDELEFSRLS